MKKRLFLAMPLSIENRAKLLEYMENGPANIRWTTEENLHITVYFCGDTDEEKIPEMINKLEQSLKNQKPLTLKFKQIAFGPPKGPPRMIWAEYEENPDFSTLSHNVYNTVKSYLEPDAEIPRQKITPHITLARFRNPDEARIRLVPAKISDAQLYKIQLISSELAPGGAKYTIIKEYEIV